MEKGNKIAIQVQLKNGQLSYFNARIKTHIIPAPHWYTLPGNLCILRGMEGDYSKLRSILLQQQIIGDKNEWLFSNGHLVILGNGLDKAAELCENLWFIYSLEERAQREGGYVHFIIGENETDNLNTPWTRRHPIYAKKDKNPLNTTAFFSGNSELLTWLRSKNTLEIIGNYVFTTFPVLTHAPLYSVGDWLQNDVSGLTSTLPLTRKVHAFTRYPENAVVQGIITTNPALTFKQQSWPQPVTYLSEQKILLISNSEFKFLRIKEKIRSI